MRDNDYIMLMTSLPYHGPLFAATQTPLSRLKLQRRLKILPAADQACLAAIEELLQWDRLDAQDDDAGFVRQARKTLAALDNQTLKEIVVARLEVRSLIAALRRRAKGLAAPAETELWAIGRWSQEIRKNWTEPHFGLLRACPWLADAKRYLETGDALALERLLLGLIWNSLARKADGHHFDFEALVIYVLRWDIIDRWTRYNADQASARFHQLIDAGLSGHGDLFPEGTSHA